MVMNIVSLVFTVVMLEHVIRVHVVKMRIVHNQYKLVLVDIVVSMVWLGV